MSGMNDHGKEFDLRSLMDDEEIAKMIPTSRIHPDPNQPRKTFPEESLKELTDSIRDKGVLSPLIVRQNGNGYIIITGERRHKASVLAGLLQIPCIVKNVSEEEAFELSLAENLHREDLNPVDEAAGYKKLLEKYGWTQERLGNEFRKSKAFISEILSINNLPEPILKKVHTCELPKKTIVEIAKAPPDKTEELVEKVIEQDLSFRKVKDEVKALKDEAQRKEKSSVRPVDSSPYWVFRKETIKYTKQMQQIAMIDHQKYVADDKTGIISSLRIMVEHATYLLEVFTQRNGEQN